MKFLSLSILILLSASATAFAAPHCSGAFKSTGAASSVACAIAK